MTCISLANIRARPSHNAWLACGSKTYHTGGTLLTIPSGSFSLPSLLSSSAPSSGTLAAKCKSCQTVPFVHFSWQTRDHLQISIHNLLPESRSTSQDLTNAMGSMYAAVLFIGVMNCTSVQPMVAVERSVFYRERAAGMYSAFPYAFGQVNGFPGKETPSICPFRFLVAEFLIAGR